MSDQLTPFEKYRLERDRKLIAEGKKPPAPKIDPERTDPRSLWYGTAGPKTARVMIVGESWGENEEKKKQPFVGNTGFVLDEILAATGPTTKHPRAGAISRMDCFITNVVPARPAGNHMWRFFYSKKEVAKREHEGEVRGLYPKKIVLEGLKRLQAQIEAVKPDLIIGLGNYTLWALTSSNFSIGLDNETKSTLVPGGIGNWRGSQLRTSELVPGIPFLPTFHPASTFHQYPNKFLIQHDLNARAAKALQGNWDCPEWDFITRPNFSQVMATIDWLLEMLHIGPMGLAVDIETRFHHISCCGLAWNSRQAICIPFMTSETDDVNYWSPEEEAIIVGGLRRILLHENVRLYGQNFLYDAQYFALYWACAPKIALDTMITHHVLWPGTPRGLDYLSSLYCDHHIYWKEDGKDWLKQLGEDTNWVYNCTDCVRTYEIANKLRRLVTEEGMEYPFKLQHQRWGLAYRMMLRGIRVDLQRRLETRMELAEAISVREAEIDDLIPEDIWPRQRKKNGELKTAPWFRSPTQQRQIIYDVLGVKPVIDRKTHRPTLNSEAIAIVQRREPLLKCILTPIEEMRSLAKFSDFVKMRLDPDNRMRCYFDPSGTETFRYASRENAFGNGGNLENISKGREDD